MLKPLPVLAMIVVLSGICSDCERVGLHAQEQRAADVSGRWAMTADSPHGTLSMTLDLTQKGKDVTGTFVNPHGTTSEVRGEFSDATLKLATTGSGEVSFTARLTDKGTLAGHLSSPMGDLKWTAERARSDRK